MKKFILKFSVVLLLFFLPAGYFKFIAVPEFSGDLGHLGMIQFGHENNSLDIAGYKRNHINNSQIINVSTPDSLQLYSLVTIGDSFSQKGEFGYQYKLSALLGIPIVNYETVIQNSIVNQYLMLYNGGFLKSGQTVILETVERKLIKAFANADFNSEFKTDKEITDKQEQVIASNHKTEEPFLSRYFSWIRLKLGISNPVAKFALSSSVFSSSKYSNQLFVYNSPTIDDGDLLWNKLSDSQFDIASNNMLKLIEISQSAGINLIIVIATDKYDAYEPLITEQHEINPTLNHLPDHQQIFNSCNSLRQSIMSGVKDVYQFNDTHWSVVGADIIADALYAKYKENLKQTAIL